MDYLEENDPIIEHVEKTELVELSAQQSEYLRELYVEPDIWESMDLKAQKEHIGLIEDRFKELNIPNYKNHMEEWLNSIYGTHLKDSYFQLERLLKTGWSSAITDYIRDMEEAEVYIKAGLVEGRVNGKPALLNPAIKGEEYNCRNWYGDKHPEYRDWCNADLMGEGYPPHDKNGDPFELHHIGQRPDSPLAELTGAQHHDNGNFQALHKFDEYSTIERDEFDKERAAHWMARFQDFKDCYSKMK